MVDDPNWPRASEWLALAPDRPALVVTGVPTSSSSISYSEAWRTPKALREVLKRFSTLTEQGQDISELPVKDAGDWTISHLDPQASHDFIRDEARKLPHAPVRAFLGGDNSITRPLLTGLAGGGLERAGLITFDSHHDVRDLSAGPTNGTPIRGLVEDGLPGENIVQIGILGFANSQPYRDWVTEQGIHVATMHDVETWGIESIVTDALDYLSESCDAIYVDVDLDVLDRAFAPACPGARPGGMTPRQLMAGVRRCGLHERVSAADFVEVDAAADVSDMTLMNLASAFLSFVAGVAARRDA